MKFKLLCCAITFILVSSVGFANTYDIKKERLGKLYYGMSDREAKNILGKPTSTSKAEFMHATGEWEQLWEYKPLGIKLGLCATQQNGPALLCKIFVEAPSQLNTSRSIHIGSTVADIQKAYQNEINMEESSIDNASKEQQIIVGSIYGGLIFTVKDSKVSEIFIGAAAE